MKNFFVIGAIAVVAVLVWLNFQKQGAMPNQSGPKSFFFPSTDTQVIPSSWQPISVPPIWWQRYRWGNGIIQPAGPIALDTNTVNAQ